MVDGCPPHVDRRNALDRRDDGSAVQPADAPLKGNDKQQRQWRRRWRQKQRMEQCEYTHKVVRDLAWSIGLLSPPLLARAANDGDALALWEKLLAATRPWLAELDAGPTRLDEFLGTLSGLGRVQNYHAGLVQFWLSHARLDTPSPEEQAADQHGGHRAQSSEPERKTLWGLQVGGRRLTSDLKILSALHLDELDGLAGSTALHVEPSLVFAIDNSSSLHHDHADSPRKPSALPGTGDGVEASGIPLGALVSFDLDANLQYRLEVSMHKMQIAGCAYTRPRRAPTHRAFTLAVLSAASQ